MALHELSPSTMLKEFIRLYRLVDFEFNNNQTIPHKVYPPKPQHCLTFYPKDLEQVEFPESGMRIGNLRTVLNGLQTEVSHRFVGKSFLLFQVVFKPGALFRITGIPSYELTNSYIDAEIVFSKEIKSVNEKLLECKNYHQMVTVIENFLLDEINRKSLDQHRIDKVNNSLFSRDNVPAVDILASESCMSIRHYQRVFKERMGVSPKFFLKVKRFETAYQMKNKYPHLDWLTVAVHCGYYDYQHLVKDFKDLINKTPNEFCQIDLSAPERLFGNVDTF
jgi:AraC-like DNA-binding protein